MDNPLRTVIPSGQNGFQYDPDSSPLIWKANAQNYKSKYKLYSEFNFKSPEYYFNRPDINSDCNRLFVFAKDEKKFEANPHVFRLGGDTDWNFQDENKCWKNKFGKLNKLITKEELKKRLLQCNNMHHTPLNFSIMPPTGNMQGVKSIGYGDWLDRFDSFASIVNDYYTGHSNMLLTGNDSNQKMTKEQKEANRKSIEKYLSYFDNVYDYFEQHYFINDRDFIKRLIESGKKKIEKQNDVERYISLAEEYWNLKEEYLTRLK